ncbi:hypothetical protein SEA_JUBIE_139 [Mycobacterium phage Jubie]|uniref:hypothetical protein n=1 Tax=Mycobacterium phage Snenia TaxID=1698714 RepID=UPI0006CE2EA0|nr:hypothetical protein AVU96_gp051 [Mycobacterium phage Snenia]ALF01584.1 hypothetical protein SNENIA_138 [Mycobacterium phage Snenia]ASM62859.1 hypothetical protein SEA_CLAUTASTROPHE_131 [Mycobacterium phage Clautastrophe]QPL15012.1 hypothetical protein SEA_JUBIE_139 [Mycobacterium phage Jubie]
MNAGLCLCEHFVYLRGVVCVVVTGAKLHAVTDTRNTHARSAQEHAHRSAQRSVKR